MTNNWNQRIAPHRSNLGIYVYAAGAIFLGLVGLASGAFATPWQYVNAAVPFRAPFAYLTAIIELAAGLALLTRGAARAGALALTVVYALFMLLWVPQAFINVIHFNYGAMGYLFEEFSLVIGGLVVLAQLSPGVSFLSRHESLLARIFGLCPISFGIRHIWDTMPGLVSWIPRWAPPGQLFWAYTTTICFFLAAIAILTGVMAPLAARLLTVEIVGFEILVWIPKLIAGSHNHFNWNGNAISVALAGAAWVVSDSLCRTKTKALSTENRRTASI